MEVIRYKIVVAMVLNGRNESRKGVSITKCALLDFSQDLGKIRINCVRAIVVSMAKVLDIFSKITEEEYVIFTNLTGDFDLSMYVSRRSTGESSEYSHLHRRKYQ